MSAAAAYAPPRDIASKLERRLTLWRQARPVTLAFDRPTLTVCFDDFPRDAALNGAAALERHGGRGSFYAAADLAGRGGPGGPCFEADDLARLSERGHEIGCHTFAHLDCAQLSSYDALTDIARNRDALAAMGLRTPLRTLAYPYGETSAALKASLPPRFLGARGIAPGLNVGRVDLAQLRAYPLFGAGALERAHRALRRAARRNAWLIVFTHDVSDAPSAWGTRTADLDAFVATASGAGFAVSPMCTVLESART